MTVSTTTYYVNALGNGATTVFNFDFIADSSSTMEVFYVDVDDVSTLLNPSQYTLFINPPTLGQLWGIGGTVTYPISGSPIASGTKLVIQRDVPYIQTVSINNQGAFYPRAVEQALDLLELQIQQLLPGGLNGGGTGSNLPARIAFEFLGGIPPTASQLIGMTSFPVQVSFPCNFLGSTGHVITAPNDTFTAVITHNEDGIGTMVIDTFGTVTFTTDICSTKIYEIGDYMKIIAPLVPDNLISDLAWTFIGQPN